MLLFLGPGENPRLTTAQVGRCLVRLRNRRLYVGYSSGGYFVIKDRMDALESLLFERSRRRPNQWRLKALWNVIRFLPRRSDESAQQGVD
jgi:hypothetical protein